MPEEREEPLEAQVGKFQPQIVGLNAILDRSNISGQRIRDVMQEILGSGKALSQVLQKLEIEREKLQRLDDMRAAYEEIGLKTKEAEKAAESMLKVLEKQKAEAEKVAQNIKSGFISFLKTIGNIKDQVIDTTNKLANINMPASLDPKEWLSSIKEYYDLVVEGYKATYDIDIATRNFGINYLKTLG